MISKPWPIRGFPNKNSLKSHPWIAGHFAKLPNHYICLFYFLFLLPLDDSIMLLIYPVTISFRACFCFRTLEQTFWAFNLCQCWAAKDCATKQYCSEKGPKRNGMEITTKWTWRFSKGRNTFHVIVLNFFSFTNVGVSFLGLFSNNKNPWLKTQLPPNSHPPTVYLHENASTTQPAWISPQQNGWDSSTSLTDFFSVHFSSAEFTPEKWGKMLVPLGWWP